MTRRELHAEIAELRGTLGLRTHRTISEWEAMPQEVRDGLAARAFVAESGDPTSAFVRLGFAGLNKLPKSEVQRYRDYVRRVFGTPGVQAILKRDLASIDKERASMLARQVRIALHGQDADAVRAFEGLVKVCGWTFQSDSTPVTTGSRATVEPPDYNSADAMDAVDELLRGKGALRA